MILSTVYPREMPSWVRYDPIRSAECKVYDVLKAQLKGSYFLFYSRPWIGLTKDGREIDGEADFVVAHPEVGILTLEVKGGEVQYDPNSDTWMSTDRYKIVHRIKNPVQQAKSSKHQILQKLRNANGWHGGRFRARHGVIFPDCERTSLDLAPDLPVSICAFIEDMAVLGSWVDQRMGTPSLRQTGESPLGDDGIALLESLLARPFRLHTPLGHILKQGEQEIVLLTDEQFQILDGFASYQQLAVAGGAGTGKTLLAIEKARRSSAEGKRTLLVCYNRPLATYLGSLVGHSPRLTVMTFHELCAFAAREYQIPVPSDLPPSVLFGERLPKALEAAMCGNPALRFDAIIVDEGQDFQPSWWAALESSLTNPTTGVLFVFYDDRQQVYEWPATYVKGMPRAPFRLTRNVRNAKPIFEEARPYFGNCIVRPAGPDGPPVERHRANNCQEAYSAVAELLDTLIQREGIPPTSVAVLLAHEGFSRAYRNVTSFGNYRTCNAEDRHDGAIVVDTVRRFKGLEAMIVILVWSGPAACPEEIAYVGLTRARGQLYEIVLD